MKDGRARECLCREYGIPCFEIEAADSHKNKIWQIMRGGLCQRTPHDGIGMDSSLAPGSVPRSSCVIFPHPLPSTVVGLGWLCINTQISWIDFCTLKPELRDEDKIMAPSTRIRDIIRNTSLFGKLRKPVLERRNRDDQYIAGNNSTCREPGPGQSFRNLSQENEAKKWLQTVFKCSCKAYMIVGKHFIVGSVDSADVPSVLPIKT